MSDENGFTVFLCPDCHQYGSHAVHRCRETALKLKARCQRVYEKTHGRDEFIALVGRNYL
jgi:ribosomal protein L44E